MMLRHNPHGPIGQTGPRVEPARRRAAGCRAGSRPHAWPSSGFVLALLSLTVCSAQRSAAASASELPAPEWADDGVSVKPPILKIDEEPKRVTISWKEKGPAVVRVYDFRGVLVRELRGEQSVTWNGAWPNHPDTPAPAENGPYSIEVRQDGRILHGGVVYVDRAGPAPRYLYMKAHRRFPRSKEENSPESSGEQMSNVRYGPEVCFSWWWGVEKGKDGQQFIWDRGAKKMLPPGDYGVGVYFLNGRFIFQVASDPEFRNIVYQSRHRKKPWGINVALKKGKYYWRLVGMDARGSAVLEHRDPNTGQKVPYTSQVIEFTVDPLPMPKQSIPPAPVKDMSRAEFESLVFRPEETAKWGKPKAMPTVRYTADQNAYWYGSKIKRSWLSKRLSARRRIGSFEMAFSEQAYYPEEHLIVIFKLNSDAAIHENLKRYRPPRESYPARGDYGRFYEHVKDSWKQGLDNPDNVLRLGLEPSEATRFTIRFRILSRRDPRALYEAVLPVVVRTTSPFPEGARHFELNEGEAVTAFEAPIAFEIDSSRLPLAPAGTQQLIVEATLLRAGKPVHTISRPFGRTRRPRLYRMDWGKIQLNDDGAIYINGRPVFPHSVHRGDPVTTRLHGFNANFANRVPAETAKMIHSIQVEGGRVRETARNFGKWLGHEPSFERSIRFWNRAKEADPKENILVISTTPGVWTGECKVFDFYAAEGTGFKRPLMVLPYQHVGGPELTGFTIDTGVARTRALARMGVRATIYTECGIYRIGRHLTPHGPNETMANAYAAIVHGCRGIDWFGEYSHENGGPLSHLQPDTYSQFYRVLAAQINWLQPILCAHRVEQDAAIWPKAARILKKVHDGKTYLFAVRYGTAAATGTWQWIKLGDTVAHYHPPAKGLTCHSILFGTNTSLKPDSVVRQKVLLDPKNPPKVVGVEFANRKIGLSKWFLTVDWDHRAFWGESRGLDIGLRPEGASDPSHLPMGPLPPEGRWVTLEIPVDKLGLRHSDLDDDWKITGMNFSTVDGRAFWGETQVVTEGGTEVSYVTKAEIDWCQSRDETMRITLPGLAAGKQIRVLFEDRVLMTQDGYFEDEFDRDDYDHHVYEIR